MRPRVIVYGVISLALAALFVRLGFWQLGRLQWRRALTAQVAQRLAQPPVPLIALPSDTAALRYRRVMVAGELDYAHEIVLTQRTRKGSPGVHLLTPLRIPGTDTAWLVNRGWVYSPDGRQVKLEQWRERPVQQIEAFARPIPSGDGRAAGTQSDRVMRTLDLSLVRRALPYPVAAVELVQLGDTAPTGFVPPRLTPPPPDEGSHQSYAVQWFSFATIAVIGAVLFAITDRKRGAARGTPPGA